MYFCIRLRGVRFISIGKQVQILYSTRCCKFHEFFEHSKVTVCMCKWEGAQRETSQKTCQVIHSE